MRRGIAGELVLSRALAPASHYGTELYSGHLCISRGSRSSPAEGSTISAFSCNRCMPGFGAGVDNGAPCSTGLPLLVTRTRGSARRGRRHCSDSWGTTVPDSVAPVENASTGAAFYSQHAGWTLVLVHLSELGFHRRRKATWSRGTRRL